MLNSNMFLIGKRKMTLKENKITKKLKLKYFFLKIQIDKMI